MATPNTPNAAASATTPSTRPAAATRPAASPAATRPAATPASSRPAATPATTPPATPPATPAATPAATPTATPAAATPAATPAATTAAGTRPAPTPIGIPVTVQPTMPATKSVQEVVAKVAHDHRITEISSKSEFESTIAEAGNKLVIVEFYATWCGPCKIISTKLEELAGKYEAQAMVIKLDVDECEEVAVEYNVTSMPTFVFFRNKQKISQLVGSSGEKLVENIEKLCNEKQASETTPTVDATTPSIPNPAVK